MQTDFAVDTDSSIILQVNNNGLISFSRLPSPFEHTSVPFPLRGTYVDDSQVIAPFWADVDTRTRGTVSYRESTAQDDLTRAQRDIRTAFLEQVDNFSPQSVFIATWDSVGYFDRHLDKVIIVYLSRHPISSCFNGPLS